MLDPTRAVRRSRAIPLADPGGSARQALPLRRAEYSRASRAVRHRPRPPRTSAGKDLPNGIVLEPGLGECREALRRGGEPSPARPGRGGVANAGTSLRARVRRFRSAGARPRVREAGRTPGIPRGRKGGPRPSALTQTFPIYAETSLLRDSTSFRAFLTTPEAIPKDGFFSPAPAGYRIDARWDPILWFRLRSPKRAASIEST